MLEWFDAWVGNPAMPICTIPFVIVMLVCWRYIRLKYFSPKVRIRR